MFKTEAIFNILSFSVVRGHFSLHSWGPQQTKPQKYSKHKLFGPVFVYRKEHNIMGFFACLTKRITAFPKNGLFTISPVLLLRFTWLLCFLNRMKGWETISVCTGFGRLGLASQSWSLMLSLTFQASQMSWSMLGMDTTARLEDRLLIYVVENVQSCDRECHASAYFIKYV